ncbi:MAG TPA: GxxExxY protein [bacterium]
MPHEPIPENLDNAGKQIVDSAFKVHQALGPGLLESVYEECLVYELGKRGLTVERQKEIPIQYDGETLSTRLKIDVLVENGIVIELKAVEAMLPLYQAQILTYLKLTGFRLGYLINFNVPLIKQGIQRFVL